MNNNSFSKKTDVLDLAERLANSISYRMNSFVSRRRQQRDYKLYLNSGMRPLTPGYHVSKWAQIRNALSDSSLLEVFKRQGALPANYGLGIDERIVEYPWLISRLSQKRGILLDAGSALNFEPLMELPVLKEHTIHVVTLHPESNCFWQSSVSYDFADLRNLPFRDDYFAQIACISTLEHVGLNTEIYTSERVELLQKGDYKLAAGELWRVLKPGGHLYLTMPFGQPCNLDWLQQFDSSMLTNLIALLHPREADVIYYRYGSTGWTVSDADLCRHSQYTPPEVWQSPASESSSDNRGDVDTGRAVAAGAVVCLNLVK